MNAIEPQKKYQIIQQNDEVKILLASNFKRLINKYNPAILITIVILSFISLTVSSNPLCIFIIGPYLFFNFALKTWFPSDIIITKKHIKTETKKLNFSHAFYLDIQAQIIDESVDIRIKDIHFRLNNVEELPILTEEIARLANFDFHDNQQLQNKTQVLTYKARHIKQPVFASFLTIQNKTDTLKIYDMINNRSWIEINKRVANTPIQYSRPVLDFNDDQKFYLGKIELNHIEKIVVIINKKAGILKNKHQVKVGVIETTLSYRGLNLFEWIVDTITNKENYHYIFKSKFRRPDSELTNFRDGEMIFSLLKTIAVLKNIKIEKQIIT